MRPAVYRWCKLRGLHPSEKATQEMFYIVAKQSGDPELLNFCELYESIKQTREETHANTEREISQITTALRKITEATKTESNV